MVGTTKAPPDERGGNRYVLPNATAPHLDSTDSVEKVCNRCRPNFFGLTGAISKQGPHWGRRSDVHRPKWNCEAINRRFQMSARFELICAAPRLGTFSTESPGSDRIAARQRNDAMCHQRTFVWAQPSVLRPAPTVEPTFLRAAARSASARRRRH